MKNFISLIVVDQAEVQIQGAKAFWKKKGAVKYQGVLVLQTRFFFVLASVLDYQV